MAILNIRKIGDPVLRSNTRKVEKISDKTWDLLDNMAETMYAAPGIGLAAPQVGVLLKIIVVDVDDDENGLIELINPEILSYSEEKEIIEEGCLSVPDQTADVIRASQIRVKALDREGKEFEFSAKDLLARAIQHEIDHLNGVLFIDKV